jgi:hypothetical protein
MRARIFTAVKGFGINHVSVRRNSELYHDSSLELRLPRKLGVAKWRHQVFHVDDGPLLILKRWSSHTGRLLGSHRSQYDKQRRENN